MAILLPAVFMAWTGWRLDMIVLRFVHSGGSGHDNPRPTVIRGSTLLAADDWMGRNFALRDSSPEAVLADLEAMHDGAHATAGHDGPRPRQFRAAAG